MKQEITITIQDENKGLIESRNHYINTLAENLKVYNFHTSNIFPEQMEILDDKNRKIPSSCIPFNNGQHLYFAAKLIDPVRPGDKFSVRISNPLGKEYFDTTTVKKEDLFFWSLNHCPMVECEFLCTIRFSEKFKLLHVIGAQPATQSKTEAFWRLKMLKEQVFNPVVVYKTL